MTHSKPAATTTDAGIPVDSDEHSLTVGPDGPLLLHDHYLIEQMANFNRERIPERQPRTRPRSYSWPLELTDCEAHASMLGGTGDSWVMAPVLVYPADSLNPGDSGCGSPARRTARARLDGDWRLSAACRSADPDLFFPISSAGASLAQQAEAKAICAYCPVQAECLAFAVRNGQQHGIWGGLTEEERQLAARTCPPDGRGESQFPGT